MPVTIRQKVKFPVSSAKLFELYADPKIHSRIIGSKVKMSRDAGSLFSAFDGALNGKTLYVKNKQMIVQSWRSSEWKKEDLDSILVLVFRESEKGSELEMIHANVPDHDAEGVTKGWKEYYWEPWKAYLASVAKPAGKSGAKAPRAGAKAKSPKAVSTKAKSTSKTKK